MSSKQDSGKAGPEKSVLSKYKSRIYLKCFYRAIICYLLDSVAVYNSPSYRQCDPAPVSSKQESSRAVPGKSVLSKQKVVYGLICSYRAILLYLLNSIAVWNSQSYVQCGQAVSCKQDSGRAGPERNVLYKHIRIKEHYMTCYLLNIAVV